MNAEGGLMRCGASEKCVEMELSNLFSTVCSMSRGGNSNHIQDTVENKLESSNKTAFTVAKIRHSPDLRTL